jgi:hypothetical protein
MCKLGATTELRPYETVSTTYKLRTGTPGMEGGRYKVHQRLGYNFSNPRTSGRELVWTVRFSLKA